jgi:glycosyltransferase involved in cell wall biosynthesis
MPGPDISVTFPCYNEEANVARMIESSLAVLRRLASRYEVVVSNDGSRDRTRETAESYAAKDREHVRVVNHYPNRGYGHALKVGLRACRLDWVFFTDGDCQFDLDEMERLVPFLDQHDIVTGYRGNRQDPLLRRLNARGWNLLTRAMLGIRVRDVNCAFRFYRKSFLDAITIESDGAMINAEMYAKARRLGMRVKEVEVSHYPRTQGKQTGANPKVIAKAFRELFALRRGLK